MKAVSAAILYLILITGITLTYYKDHPIFDFLYFSCQSLVPLVLLIFIHNMYSTKIIKAGIVLYSLKVIYEIIILPLRMIYPDSFDSLKAGFILFGFIGLSLILVFSSKWRM